MRAAIYSESGPARRVLALTDLPDEAPGPGAVTVRIAASGVNPTDVKMRGGAPGRRMPFARIVPHHDGAGTVAAVGAGVDGLAIGQRVWVFGAQNGRAFGTAAECVTLPAGNVLPLPDDMDFAAGACLGVPPMTAWAALFLDAPVAPGAHVLVTGGAGNVGGYAVQMARRAGARVIATVSSPEKADVARALGADVAVTYRDPDAAAQVRAATGGAGVDVAVDVDTTGNAALLGAVMANGGRIVSYGSSGLDGVMPIRDLRQANVTVRFLNILRLPVAVQRRAAEGVATMLAAAPMTHRIALSVPLDRIAEAHEAVEAGAVGRVIVTP